MIGSVPAAVFRGMHVEAALTVLYASTEVSPGPLQIPFVQIM